MKRPAILRAMTAFIYCRVSTGRQVDGSSLDTQRQRCIEYCEREGWRVVRVFVEEGASAKSTDRPVFQEMLKECRKHKGTIGYIVVYSMSRFARNASDHFNVRAQLHKLNIALRSATEAINDSAYGEFFETLAAGQAQLDNRIRSDLTYEAMVACVSSGRWMWRPMIGYLKGSKGGPSLVQDPERASFIRTCFELVLGGEMSKAQVLAEVTALGLRKRNGRPLTPQDFSKLIENPIYSGRIVIAGWNKNVKGDFEAIVDEATFHRVQAILKGEHPTTRRHVLNNPDFPLRRFVTCTWCDSPYTGSRSKGRRRSYGYYRCRTPKRPEKREHPGSVPKLLLEAKFVETLQRLAPTGQVGALFRAIVRDVWNRRRTEEAAQRRKLTARLAELTDAQRSATKAVTNGTIDKSAYDDLMGELRTASELAKLELQRVTSDDLELERILDLAERLLNDPAKLWTEMDPERRARLQRFIYPDGITFDGETFGTAPTCGIFGLVGSARAETGPPTPVETGVGGGMVTPRGFEPLSPG